VIARAIGASVVGKLAGGAIATMAPYTGTWEFCPGVTVTEDRRRSLIRAPVSAPCGRIVGVPSERRATMSRSCPRSHLRLLAPHQRRMNASSTTTWPQSIP